MKQTKRWKPRKEEKYWYITSIGDDLMKKSLGVMMSMDLTKEIRDLWIKNISEMIDEINEKYKKKEVWKPIDGERYYRINTNGINFVINEDKMD